MQFIDALLKYPFLQYALAAGVLSSVACGLVGSYVIVRRISYIAGGISHCVLGGIGAARYLQVTNDWTWLDPLYGAVLAALVAAMIIGVVSLRAKEREDAVIGALWSIGMAAGVLFMQATPGYASDLQSYLFGSILMVDPQRLVLIVVLDLMVVGLAMLFYNPFLAVCFDQEFARLRGVSVELFYLLLLALTALTVVVLASVVGILLVIALLTLPVAIAGYFCRTLGQLILASIALSVVFTIGGLASGYELHLPPGPMTIVLAGGAYLLVAGIAVVARRGRA